MTKHFENALGLPHLDDILREQGVADARDEIEDEVEETSFPVQTFHGNTPSPIDVLLSNNDHSKKMDQVYDEVIDHAQKVMDLGYNIDPARAPRMFEVATGLYKAALDAASSKRDAQLKMVKLMQDQQKIDMERQRNTGVGGPDEITTQAVVVEDRNILIKRLREQAQAEK